MSCSNRAEKQAGTPEFFLQLKAVRAFGVEICEPDRTEQYDILVDALFGIGLTRTIEGDYAALLERINREKHTVIAVDIASGVSATTGMLCGAALRADETVTFGAAKCGHLLYPGKEYTGKLRVASIGFPKSVVWEHRRGFYFAPEKIDCIVPVRPAYSNKGTFGKVAVIAGSKDMAGAAYFAACAAYRTGAGLVRILTPECNREILQTLLPEAMLTAYKETEELSQLTKELLQFADALVIGPGLGQTEKTNELIHMLRDQLCELGAAAPVSVWDADALNLVAKKMSENGLEAEEERRAFMETWFPENAILTPHPGELSRLLGKAIKEITGEFLFVAERLAGKELKSKLTFVLKDAVSLVVNESECFFQTLGNNGMATGGSGDVLCGVIAALSAAGMDCFSAAATGVWFHGMAGDKAAQKVGTASMIAGDLLQAIGNLFAEKKKEGVKG